MAQGDGLRSYAGALLFFPQVLFGYRQLAANVDCTSIFVTQLAISRARLPVKRAVAQCFTDIHGADLLAPSHVRQGPRQL